MEVTILLTADYANYAEGGKLNVMGIFSKIFAQNFPVLHPEMYLVIQLSAGAAEYGRKFQLNIKLLDEDAVEEIVNLSVTHEVPRGEGGRLVNINQIARLQTLFFPKPGTYQFSVLVDNDVKRTLALEVEKLPNPQME